MARTVSVDASSVSGQAVPTRMKIECTHNGDCPDEVVESIRGRDEYGCQCVVGYVRREGQSGEDSVSCFYLLRSAHRRQRGLHTCLASTHIVTEQKSHRSVALKRCPRGVGHVEVSRSGRRGDRTGQESGGREI